MRPPEIDAPVVRSGEDQDEEKAGHLLGISHRSGMGWIAGS